MVLLVYIQTYVCENVAITCKRAPPFFFLFLSVFNCLLPLAHVAPCLGMSCLDGMRHVTSSNQNGINGKFQLLSTAKFKTKDWNSGYGHNKSERSWHVTEMSCTPELRLTPRAGLADSDYYRFKWVLTWACKEKRKKKGGGGRGGPKNGLKYFGTRKYKRHFGIKPQRKTTQICLFEGNRKFD